MVAVSKEQRNIKYVVITSAFVCFILWMTVYTPSLDMHSSDEDYANKEKDTIAKESSALCTPKTFSQGTWIHDPVDIRSLQNATQFAQVAGYHCLKKFAHRCFRRGENELARAKQIMDYRWQPNNCELLEMNTKKLADHLLNHPILFIGDSITQLQFESLGCLLGNHFPNRHPIKSDLNGGNSKIRVNELASLKKDTSSIAFIRSDYLLRLDDYQVILPFDEPGVQLGSGENHPWAQALDKFNYVVINTGPHWHPNLQWGPNATESELLMAFKKAMSNVLDYLVENVKSHQKVWIRTTPYGHVKCSQFKGPQENPLAPSGRTGEYEWHLFKEFDLIWEELLAALPLVNGKKDARFDMLEIATLTNKRGDAHSKPDADCLHTCIPGPVDTWNKLLNHEIMKSVAV